MLNTSERIHVLRDPTRGGVASALKAQLLVMPEVCMETALLPVAVADGLAETLTQYCLFGLVFLNIKLFVPEVPTESMYFWPSI